MRQIGPSSSILRHQGDPRLSPRPFTPMPDLDPSGPRSIVSLIRNIDHLYATRGISAVVVTQQDERAQRGDAKWTAILSAALDLRELTGQSAIRITLEEHSVVIQREQGPGRSRPHALGRSGRQEPQADDPTHGRAGPAPAELPLFVSPGARQRERPTRSAQPLSRGLLTLGRPFTPSHRRSR